MKRLLIFAGTRAQAMQHIEKHGLSIARVIVATSSEMVAGLSPETDVSGFIRIGSWREVPAVLEAHDAWLVTLSKHGKASKPAPTAAR